MADAAGRILLVDTRRPGAAPVILEDGLPRVWSLDLAAIPGPGGGAALVVGLGDTLVLVDLPPVPAVQLEMPSAPLYLSSWARIGVALSGGLGLDDLVLRVEPPEGGLVSQSRDATFAHRPSVILAASAVPGSYKLVVQERATGDELLGEPFEITDAWDGVDGPPVSHIGAVGVDSPDPAWGGGDPFVPQNLGVTPALGTRNVAVVILETNDSTALSAADQATLRTEWLDEVFNGVTRGGVVESTRNYWRDVSEGRLDLANAGVVGPIRLPNAWASYGTSISMTTGQTDGWEGFARAAVADLRAQNEAAAAAGNPPVVDLLTVDSIILVGRSLPAAGANPGRFLWPSATRPGGYQLSFEVAQQRVSVPFPFGSIEVSVPIMRTIQMFAMPDDWETRESSGRVRGETASHELGHNLGLPDEYARSGHPQWAKDRDLASSTTLGARPIYGHGTIEPNEIRLGEGAATGRAEVATEREHGLQRHLPLGPGESVLAGHLALHPEILGGNAQLQVAESGRVTAGGAACAESGVGGRDDGCPLEGTRQRRRGVEPQGVLQEHWEEQQQHGDPVSRCWPSYAAKMNPR